MPLPLLPLAVLSLAGIAWRVNSTRKSAKHVDPAVAAERAVIYDLAINSKADPDKLRTLAQAFREEGMEVEADMIEKRAALAEAPPDVKAERTAIYKQALGSKNPEAIREVAAGFDELGASGAAVKLRSVATGLETAMAEARAAEIRAESNASIAPPPEVTP